MDLSGYGVNISGKEIWKMTTKEAIAYFGSIKALADELKVWPQTVYQWGERPPLGRQYELELKTRGELKADDDNNH